jgi:hypothetical protein
MDTFIPSIPGSVQSGVSQSLTLRHGRLPPQRIHLKWEEVLGMGV